MKLFRLIKERIKSFADRAYVLNENEAEIWNVGEMQVRNKLLTRLHKRFGFGHSIVHPDGYVISPDELATEPASGEKQILE